MAEVELLLPKMGESVAEATIVKWLKQEGESVDLDESVIEIATDKVDSDVPSPSAGVLAKQLVNEGDVVQVGQPIAIIATEGESSGGSNGQGSKEEVAAAPAPAVVESAPTTPSTPAPAPVAASTNVASPVAIGEMPERTGPSGKFYSPLVRNIASKEGISMQELEAIPGTGNNGRVTKKDILNYLPQRTVGATQTTAAPAPAPATSAQPVAPSAAPKMEPVIASAGANDEIIEMDRMRKLIADHMVMSKQVSPHVTSYVEADVTNVVQWRERVKHDFQKREGEKITYTPIFIEAIVKAIKDLPMVNVSVDGYNIIAHKNINIGMATATPQGNLIVPVIKHADRYNLTGLTAIVNDLAARARSGNLKPEEIQEGTYTITNVGTFGNVMGTPIINQPQVAIMAVGAIRKVPAVIETPQGDTIGIRHKIFLSHSYDHRVVDGALGGTFVRKMADYLEAFDPNREF